MALTSSVAKFYLILYNFIQCAGWAMILFHLVENTLKNGLDGKSLWVKTKMLLIVFQTGAILEIIHSALGLVSSKVGVVVPQVFSRVFLLWPIVIEVPEVTNHYGFTLMVAAWSITEVMRYAYYGLNQLSIVPYVLQWARYTFFIALYPLGITGELLCAYNALPYYNSTNRLSVLLPNSWNFAFSFQYFIIIVMLTYIPEFPKLYFHMWGQRRKVLGKKDQ